MSSAKELAIEGQVDKLHLTIIGGSGKFICFTLCIQDGWTIHVTDGIDVWKTDLDLENLNSHRDLCEVSSYEAYFSRFRHAFSIGDVLVTKQAHKVCVDVGTGSTALKYDLYECTANERKIALQTVLFWLAETATVTTKKLSDCENELATFRRQQGGGGAASTGIRLDLDVKKHSGSQAKAQKQQGHSMVNPTSKKRKAAKGVEFE